MADFDKFYLFCDESATQHRFTVIGLVVCSEGVAVKFEHWLGQIVEKHGGSDDLKWTKVKKHNLALYRDFTTAFFSARNRGYAHYYGLVVDNSRMNHRLYNEGDKEIGFNKMLFQLLYKLIREYRSRPRFYAFLDERTTKHSPDRLRKMLNSKAARDLKIVHNPYRVCRFRRSHDVRLIQLADIITGAIGYKVNGQDTRADAAKCKLDLLEHIREGANVSSLGKPTHWPANGFDVWHIDLTARARGIRRA